ncbi:MAG TPA: hypothetical protein ENG92_00180 [Thiolapillus brandeum]|uniref:Uncharacterized protein n=1 Tax=Thiolapillus brandeum TaxID=1076588 RepID=A0A831JQ69_9GAMM|nr:hypothetical protein [Thiolapillus brandeum]
MTEEMIEEEKPKRKYVRRNKEYKNVTKARIHLGDGAILLPGATTTLSVELIDLLGDRVEAVK